MPEEAEKEALRELQRFSRMSPAAAEYTISRTYLDWLVVLPWNKTSEKPISIPEAHEILDADHYNLEKVKERILEYLSVLQVEAGDEGADPLLRGAAGSGQDLARQIHRAGAGPQVRAHLARRHAR